MKQRVVKVNLRRELYRAHGRLVIDPKAKTQLQKLIDADDCDADFGIHQFERAGK